MTLPTAARTNSDNLRQEFHRQGFVFPVEVLTPLELAEVRSEFDKIEAEVGTKVSQVGLQHLHKSNPMVWRLVTHPRVLEAVSAVLGEDLLLLGSHFFCKQPDHADSFVAWHQDVTYWELLPPKAVTLWLAIDDADVANGAMRFIPGSHRGELLPHGKSSSAHNLLSVNQAIAEELVDDSQAVDVQLRAGAASLHDGMLIHGSNPNRSTRRRCGLTMRFTTPEVQPAQNEDGEVRWRPILVQGEDRFGHFQCDSWPAFVQDRKER